MYTVRIDREGNGMIDSTTYTDEDWTVGDVELCTWYYFDDKIKLISKIST
jgi:hypothetical protein